MYKIKNVLNTIICGNTLTELKKFPSESINCVITSPPYWALRDYGLKGQIWDGDEKCEHQWGNKQTILKHKSGETNPGKESWYKNKGASDDKGNQFCLKCSAWYGSLGLEPTFQLYIKHLLQIFDEIKRVLKKTGTCWVNLGDSYGGNQGRGVGKGNEYGQMVSHKQTNLSKSLCQIPSRFSIGMANNGWILRNEIIWYKKNCMPSSVKDRFTVDFEKIFFFVKSKKYWFEQQYEQYNKPLDRWGGDKLKANGKSIWDKGTGQKTYRDRNMRPNPLGRNRRCVWNISTKPNPIRGVHFAVFPEALIEPMIMAGCPKFICRSCGKAKDRIYKSNQPKREIEWHNEKYGKDDEKTKRLGRMQPQKSVYNTSEFIGYTDCGCNAGFEGGIVLDPFAGIGTVGAVGKQLNRNYILIDLKPKYCKMAEKRINNIHGSLF